MSVYKFEDLKSTHQNPKLSSGFGETIKGDKMYFCHRIWPTGTEAKPHFHPCEQFIYILRGRQNLILGDKKFEVGPGEVIHVPSNTVHSTKIIEEVEAVYVKDTTWSLKGVAAGDETPSSPPEDDPF